MKRSRIAFLLLAGLFLTLIPCSQALPQTGPAAEFRFASDALTRSKIYACFTAGGVKNIGFITVDSIPGRDGFNCAGVAASPITTTQVEMAEETRNNINTSAAYDGSNTKGLSTKYIAKLVSDVPGIDVNTYPGSVSTVCNQGRSNSITAWNVFCYNCAEPYSSPSVVLQSVCTCSACIPPPNLILPGPGRVLPIVTAAPPRLEFRGRPTRHNAEVQVQATALPGTTGPLVTVSIPQGTPLDDLNEQNPSVGSLVTNALNTPDINGNRYLAKDLHMLQPFWTDDENERSLFVEIQEVIIGDVHKKPERVDIFIYDSSVSAGLVLADPDDLIGYGVTFLDVQNTGGDPPVYGSIVVFPTPEVALATDLNGDGDLEDQVLRFENLETGEVFNTGLAVSGRSREIDIYEKTVVFTGEEDEISFYDITTGAVERLGVAGSHPTIHGRRATFESGGFIWHFDLETKTLTNTHTPGQSPSIYGDLIAFHSNASSETTTIRYLDLQTGKVTDTGAAGLEPSLYENVIAFKTLERQVNLDLNGDGDTSDSIIRYHDVATGATVTTPGVGSFPMIHGNRIVFSTSEVEVSEDLNGDGRILGSVIQFYNLATGEVVNTRSQGTEPDIYKDTMTYYVWEHWASKDLNHDGDTKDPIVRIENLPATPEFIRGDCNQDLRTDVSDAVVALNFSFGGKRLGCVEACDVNASGRLDISDPIALLNHLFLGSPAPPVPFPSCGTQKGFPGLLGCDEPACQR